MLDRSLSSLSSRTKWQRLPAADTLCSVSPAGNRCHFVLLDKDESSPTADLSKIGCPNGPDYSTGELLNTPQVDCSLSPSSFWNMPKSAEILSRADLVVSSRLTVHNSEGFCKHQQRVIICQFLSATCT